ncbi:MAG TPA: ISAs1 family transposase [Blastocatellia bacterium]|nr:ISAs1 family transposase [Blastocatellia bacterium]
MPSLAQALSLIPDFRQPQGRRYELLPVLLLSCVAVLCGCRSQSAISDWGRNYGSCWLRKLGFSSGRAPSQPTLHRIFKGIDHLLIEQALTARSQKVLARSAPISSELEPIAIDGKTLCGSSKQGAKDAHLLSCLSHRLGIVLAQIAVDDKTNEITKVDDLLEGLVLTGKVVTGDAMITQRAIAESIVSRGGDYLLVVKDNQPQLLEDIKMSFGSQWWLRGTFCEGSLSDQHGNRVHQWHLQASTLLEGYSSWPGLKQVLKLKREVTNKSTGEVSQETTYAITSLGRERAGPVELIKIWREHWHIENRLHWVRDVTFDEDRSQVRSGHIPQVMAALRNAAISVMRIKGQSNIAAACRRFAAQPGLALKAVGLQENE